MSTLTNHQLALLAFWIVMECNFHDDKVLSNKEITPDMLKTTQEWFNNFKVLRRDVKKALELYKDKSMSDLVRVIGENKPNKNTLNTLIALEILRDKTFTHVPHYTDLIRHYPVKTAELVRFVALNLQDGTDKLIDDLDEDEAMNKLKSALAHHLNQNRHSVAQSFFLTR